MEKKKKVTQCPFIFQSVNLSSDNELVDSEEEKRKRRKSGDTKLVKVGGKKVYMTAARNGNNNAGVKRSSSIQGSRQSTSKQLVSSQEDVDSAYNGTGDSQGSLPSQEDDSSPVATGSTLRGFLQVGSQKFPSFRKVKKPESPLKPELAVQNEHLGE